MKSKIYNNIKSGDVVIFIVIIVLIAVTFIFSLGLIKGNGKKAVVKVDNKVYASYSLSENTTQRIKTKYGYNVLVIKDGCVFIRESDCRDKICINFGKKAKPGDSIVCLPHRLVVEVTKD